MGSPIESDRTQQDILRAEKDSFSSIEGFGEFRSQAGCLKSSGEGVLILERGGVNTPARMII